MDEQEFDSLFPYETEYSPAPIGPAPGVGAIQPTISLLWQALGHVPHQVRPHLFRSQMPRTNPCNRFDVGGNLFLDPMVFFGDRWKGQMNHLVGQCPIRGEPRPGRLAAHTDGNSPAVEGSESHSVADTPSAKRRDLNVDRRNRELPIIDLHGFGRRFYPNQNVFQR